MEGAAVNKDQSSASGKSSFLRYPLRSATKSKEAKSPLPAPTISSSSKRGRPPSSVSKSMGVLDLSGKGKPVKPARRLSIPTKPTTSATKSVGNITPISETRAKKPAGSQVKSDTPTSDVSRSLNRKKFSVISSASYWLNQIKLSESAAKHSISLGLFKLASDAGCEPLQRMREELIAYARKHNLAELGDVTKELFESYNIAESFEQMQLSETISRALEDGTQSSDDDMHSSSTVGDQNLKPKLLNSVGSSRAHELVKGIPKKSTPAPRTRASVTKGFTDSKSASNVVGQKKEKKNQKPSKANANVEKQKVKKPAAQEAPVSSSVADKPLEENKENMDAPQLEEISVGDS